MRSNPSDKRTGFAKWPYNILKGIFPKGSVVSGGFHIKLDHINITLKSKLKPELAQKHPINYPNKL